MAIRQGKDSRKGRKFLLGGLRGILRDPKATPAEKLKAAELLIKIEGLEAAPEEEKESSTTSALKTLLEA